MLKRVEPKKLDEICREWSAVCQRRDSAIVNGRDVSLISVITPCIIRHLKIDKPKNLLDVGCGTGYLTYMMSKHVRYCVGIDFSEQSISLAKEHYGGSSVSFVSSEIRQYKENEQFDVCTSNMVFMSDPSWVDSAKHIWRLLVPNGKLYVMITHPCFWPKYWGFDNEIWYNYNEEIFIENDFSITYEKSMGKTTYIHRSLSQYLQGLKEAGFAIESLEEPYPVKEMPKDYEYSFPRFLLIKCIKKVCN